MTIDAVTTTTIDVSWTHSAGGKDQYRVDCVTTSPGVNKTATADDNQNTATCIDVTPGTQYSVTVTAVLSDDEQTSVAVPATTSELLVCMTCSN